MRNLNYLGIYLTHLCTYTTYEPKLPRYVPEPPIYLPMCVHVFPPYHVGIPLMNIKVTPFVHRQAVHHKMNSRTFLSIKKVSNVSNIFIRVAPIRPAFITYKMIMYV